MKGSCIIYRPGKPVEYRTFTGAVDGQYWNEIVDGLIELLPRFSSWEDANGKLSRCVAFCNQEGTALLLQDNYTGTAIWQYIQKQQGISLDYTMIKGPLIIIFGDDDFLEAL